MISIPKLSTLGLILIATLLPYAFNKNIEVSDTINENEVAIRIEKIKLDVQRERLQTILKINDTLAIR